MAVASEYIILAGEKFPVGRLALKQLRLVVPTIITLMEEIGPQMLMATSDTTNAFSMISAINLKPEQFDTIIHCILPVLQRMKPSITFEELLDMEIGMIELINALPVVMRMTGLIEPTTKSKTTKEGAEPGEASPPSS